MNQPKQPTEPVGFGYDRPDFSYLPVPKPRPQVYEGDTYVGEAFGLDAEILPRLGEEDGMVMGSDGNLHSIYYAGIANKKGSFDHRTVNFVSQAATHQHAIAEHPTHKISVREAPGTLAMRITVKLPNQDQGRVAGRHRADSRR
jgi:hypothetical protein